MSSDLFFISCDEPNADQNWARLRSRFPRAVRVQGVPGIRAAHVECARRSATELFFVVDGDNEVSESFDFSYAPPADDRLSTHVWRCLNPVNDLVYGHGAIKLCPKAAFLEAREEGVDVATSAALRYKIMPEIASVTRFNTDPFNAWKTAFRECVKLASGLIRHQNPAESRERLEAWCARGEERPFGADCLRGAREGRAYATENRDRPDALALINDFSWLRKRFDEGARPAIARSPDGSLSGVLSGLETYYGSPWIRHLRIALERFPGARIGDAMSRQQVLSKKWAIEAMRQALGPRLGFVFIVGGWYGTLAAMMFESGLFEDLRIRSFDIDPSCAPVADTMNRSWVVDGWRFKAAIADMYELDYADTRYRAQRADGSFAELSSVPDLVINTSCEHLAHFDRWISRIPRGKRLVLQSNDFFGAEDHCSCVRSLDELKTQAGLSRILFEGTLPLESYTRFMLIGEK